MISHSNAFLVGPTPQGRKGTPLQIILLTTGKGSLGQLTWWKHQEGDLMQGLGSGSALHHTTILPCVLLLQGYHFHLQEPPTQVSEEYALISWSSSVHH